MARTSQWRTVVGGVVLVGLIVAAVLIVRSGWGFRLYPDEEVQRKRQQEHVAQLLKDQNTEYSPLVTGEVPQLPWKKLGIQGTAARLKTPTIAAAAVTPRPENATAQTVRIRGETNVFTADVSPKRWEIAIGQLRNGTVNDVPWDTMATPTLLNEGATQTFDPNLTLDQMLVTVTSGSGRCAVSKDMDGDMAVSFYCDQPVPGPFELTLWLGLPKFPPLTAEAKLPDFTAGDRVAGEILIVAKVDGVDEVSIYPEHIEWAHHSGEWPGTVRVNDREWTPESQAQLLDQGETTYADHKFQNVNFQFEQARGRSPVTWTWDKDRLLLKFEDPEPGADEYTVILHSYSRFPKFALDEAAREEVRRRVAENPVRPLPKDGQRTLKDWWEDRRQWRETRLGKAWAQHGRHDPRWDEPVGRFLDVAARRTTVPDDALLELGESILALGCDDPLILQTHAYHLGVREFRAYSYRSQRHEIERAVPLGARAVPLLERAVVGFDSSQYPARVRWLAPALLAEQLRRKKTESVRTMRLNLRAVQALAETARGLQAPQETTFFYDELSNLLDAGDDRYPYMMFGNQGPRVALVLSQIPEIDPWLEHMLSGKALVDIAWSARGGGYANTVTELGWQIFHESLTAARDHYIAAWKLRPEVPSAASGLIRIVVANPDRDGVSGTPRFWFDEAVAAVFDWQPAYTEYRLFIMPRWGGTNEGLIEFGQECVRTGRFEIDVPDEITSVLRSVGDEQGDIPSLMASLNAIPDLRAAFDGYAGLASNPAEVRRMRTEQLIWCFTMGLKSEAGRLLQELRNDLDPGAMSRHSMSPSSFFSEYVPAQPAPDRTLAPRPTTRKQEGRIFCLAIAPDGEHLVSADHVGPLFVWSTRDESSRRYETPAGLRQYGMTFSRDAKLALHQGKRLPNDTDFKGKVFAAVSAWDLATGQHQDVLPLNRFSIYDLRWLPDGKHLLCAVPASPLSDKVIAWSIDRQEVVALSEPDLGGADTVEVSADGRTGLAVASSPSEMFLLDIPDLSTATAAAPARLRFGRSVSLAEFQDAPVAVTGDFTRAVVSGDDSAWLYDMERGVPLYRFPGAFCTLSPDGRRLVTYGGTSLPNSLHLWDAETGAGLAHLAEGHDSLISRVVFAPDGKTLYSGDSAGVIREWPVGEMTEP